MEEKINHKSYPNVNPSSKNNDWLGKTWPLMYLVHRKNVMRLTSHFLIRLKSCSIRHSTIIDEEPMARENLGPKREHDILMLINNHLSGAVSS